MESTGYCEPDDMLNFVGAQSTSMVRSVNRVDAVERTRTHRPIAREEWSPSVANRMAYTDALRQLRKRAEHDQLARDEFEFRKVCFSFTRLSWGMLLTVKNYRGTSRGSRRIASS